MEHPAITRTMRTGYPQDYPQEQYCEHCGYEVSEGVEYDGEKFCGTDCLGKYLVEQGDAKWIA